MFKIFLKNIVELQRRWKLRPRTKSYSQKEIQAESKKEPSPFVIPVNRPSTMQDSAAHKLALLQLRDCVFIRSGCVASTKMNTSQKSNYIDQLEAILGGKSFTNTPSPNLI
uniref:Uncharacterized protein n=1 Tax=Panagrolaimus sp. ES5 TaxID=591445 RepID=A0AC34FJR3_9BILA